MKTTDRIKWGIELIDMAMYYYNNPKGKYYSSLTNRELPRHTLPTRVDGINTHSDNLEGWGMLLGVIKNTILHPKVMYEIYVRKK